ncbi:MAG: hypothetical protein E7113_00300 [Bacteroidales bacterium]|nr:hypothetical protein [Bacteroidales bacterium]
MRCFISVLIIFCMLPCELSAQNLLKDGMRAVSSIFIKSDKSKNAEEAHGSDERIDKKAEKKIEKDTCELLEIQLKISDYSPIRNSDNLWGYKQYDRVVIAPKYQEVGKFNEGVAPVMLGGKYGYVDRDGNCVIPYKYEYAGIFSEGLARVCMGEKFGFIDKNGKTVLPYKYSDAGDFIDGLAAVFFDGKKGYIDKTGQWYDNRTEVLQTFSSFARQYVENYVNNWQKKGKYEKTADWQSRVNESTRAILVDSLLNVARTEYIAYQQAGIEHEFKLGDYDADGEIFVVYDSRFGELLVPVPISKAEKFEMEFNTIENSNIYCVENDGIGLAESVFVMSDGSRYVYSNKASLEFAQIDIDYDFDPIDLDVDAGETIRQDSRVVRKTLQVKSDIDQNIPTGLYDNDNTFAVIIANENYQRVSQVEFAASDGQTFKEYCNKTLGVPEKNIRYVQDATLVNMWEQVDWLAGIAKAYNGDAKIIFYYAGHGVPDESTKDAFLLPVDGNGSNASTGYKLSNLYSRLSENPTQSTVVLLDACFSGAERSGDMMVAARGVAIKAKAEAPKGNMVVFSAAQGDETAYPYREKGHGLFTYFLCKKLQETNGNVTLGELASYITDNVGKHAMIENSKPQTPSVMSSGMLSDKWRSITFK